MRRRERMATASRRSDAVRPSMLRLFFPAATTRFNNPTLTMKTSSMVALKIDRKRTRASSGSLLSSASSSTRELNDSWLKSRLMNCSGAGSTGPTESEPCSSAMLYMSDASIEFCDEVVRLGNVRAGKTAERTIKPTCETNVVVHYTDAKRYRKVAVDEYFGPGYSGQLKVIIMEDGFYDVEDTPEP